MSLLSQIIALQQAARECIHFWDTCFDVADVDFPQAEKLKQDLNSLVCTLLTLSPSSKEEEAEWLIGLLLSSIMVSLPELQYFVDRACILTKSIENIQLKNRLVSSIYICTGEIKDNIDVCLIPSSTRP